MLTWKLPGVFRHWPPLHKESSSSHSLISLHIFPVASTSYPLSQMHRYVPIRFSHPPLMQMLGFCAHSLMSMRAFCIMIIHRNRRSRRFREFQISQYRDTSRNTFLTFCDFDVTREIIKGMSNKCGSCISQKESRRDIIEISLRKYRDSLPSPLYVIPAPCGHKASNSGVFGSGQAWQVLPQPMGWPRITVQQQQLDFVTAVEVGLEHWPSLYCE